MGTTPNRGFPYPEGTDFVASGDDAFEALALAVDDALTTRMWCAGTGGGEGVVGDSNWGLDFAAMNSGPGFTVNTDGGVAPSFTYVGPSGRWFMVSVGCRIIAAGSSGAGLYLTATGEVMERAESGEDDTHLSLSVPVQFTAGQILSAYVRVYGVTDGQYSGAFLRAVSL